MVYKGICSAIRTQKGCDTLMQHEGQMGMNPHEMLMMKMWESLSDDQKRTLMKRMIDSKIMMKEGMMKHIQFKIETMKMIKTMLEKK
jgi:hypothetical protein